MYDPVTVQLASVHEVFPNNQVLRYDWIELIGHVQISTRILGDQDC